MDHLNIQQIVNNSMYQLEVGLLVLDLSGSPDHAPHFLWQNQKFIDLTGYTLDDLHSLGLQFLSPEDDFKAPFPLLPEKAFRCLMKVRAKTGGSFKVWVRGIPAGKSDNNSQQYFTLVLDQAADTSPKINIRGWREQSYRAETDIDIAAVKENERFLRNTVAAAGIGLWEWHVPTNNVIYSPEWFTMLGYCDDEFPAGFETFENLANPKDTADVFKKAGSAFEGELDEYEAQFRMKCKDGSWKWVRASGKVVERDAANKAVRILGTHVDISKEVAREESLRDAAIKAEEAKAAKDRFLATMSHEIRTPLNGILGMLDFVLDTPLNDQQSEYLDIAFSSAKNLLSILNQTLDYSKLTANKMDIESITFDLHNLVTECVDIFFAKATEQGITVNIKIAPDVPAALKGDANKIRQVVLNLIGNAVKFTHEGGVRLEVTLVEQLSNKASIQLEVIDTGIGIAPDALDKIFDSFQQADNSTSRRFGGSGLGLAISKEICEAIGGKITATSVEGKGSTFTVIVPLEKGDESALSESFKDPFLIEDSPITHHYSGILVVEDHAINRHIMAKLLDQLTIPFAFAEDGQYAVDMCAQKRFDLILMDIQMPRLDGVSATREIRATNNPNSATPIIALTANAIAGDREAYIEAGMTDYVSKPISKALLFQKIRDYIDSKSETPNGALGGGTDNPVTNCADNSLERAGPQPCVCKPTDQKSEHPKSGIQDKTPAPPTNPEQEDALDQLLDDL